jgi:hypothetical protein
MRAHIIKAGCAGGVTISPSPNGPQDETLWMRSAGTWFLGALVPNIVLASTSEQVHALSYLSLRRGPPWPDLCRRLTLLARMGCDDSVQMLALEPWQIGGVLLGVDCIFVATSFKFLDLAGKFDKDWHKSLTDYPGNPPSSRGRLHHLYW